MSLLTWITEKELKNRGDEFCSKKNMKIGGEKMRNANGQQGENRRRSEKKNEQEHKQQNLWWAHTTFPS